jgi:hypothetical protein
MGETQNFKWEQSRKWKMRNDNGSAKLTFQFIASAPWPSILAGAVFPLLSFLSAVLSCLICFFLSDTIAPWPSNFVVIFTLTSFLLSIYSPILFFNLSVMNNHASRHQVTTALSCVGALSVAVCSCRPIGTSAVPRRVKKYIYSVELNG